MIVMHLSQVAVAPFDRRRGPLKGLGLLRRPRLPSLQHIGCQLLGAGVCRKRGLHDLQRLYQLGLPSRATCARYLLLVWSKNSCGFARVVFQESPEPFATPNRAFTLCV